jgi:hypothetical protein
LIYVAQCDIRHFKKYITNSKKKKNILKKVEKQRMDSCVESSKR